MRGSVARRYLLAFAVALTFGALVYFYNPVDHMKADLRADAQGIRLTLEIAAHAIETVGNVRAGY